jgi:hypothetical protein
LIFLPSNVKQAEVCSRAFDTTSITSV